MNYKATKERSSWRKRMKINSTRQLLTPKQPCTDQLYIYPIPALPSSPHFPCQFFLYIIYNIELFELNHKPKTTIPTTKEMFRKRILNKVYI